MQRPMRQREVRGINAVRWSCPPRSKPKQCSDPRTSARQMENIGRQMYLPGRTFVHRLVARSGERCESNAGRDGNHMIATHTPQSFREVFFAAVAPDFGNEIRSVQ